MNIVIVESHQHALEHIHSVIRKRKIFNKPWSMLHFDAHPDLACPTVPAIACFTPRRLVETEEDAGSEGRNLYELLDSTSSGIAEWILPLVVAADLRVVEWVKPSFASQFPLGTHLYNIGAYDGSMNIDEVKNFLDLPMAAQIKVDFNHPYYWDDDSVVPSEKLALSQTMELHVSQLEGGQLESFSAEKGSKKLWALDICLDYFACLNPYITDIDGEDPAISQAFLNVMQNSRCYASIDDQPTGPSHLKDVLQFRRLVKEVLSASESSQTSTLIERLSDYYESLERATTLVEELKDLVKNNEKALSLVLEALPYWNMPHAVSSVDADRITESIRRVEKALQQYHTQPFIISIARSSDDGFTPATMVEDIQERVIQMLHRVFCGSTNCSSSSSCCFQVTRDYGQWEGSTII
jgi:hypothetical protein